jgi:hypothetical protein
VAARPKKRADAETSPPSIFTPRAMNSAPSHAFARDSSMDAEMRSPSTSGESEVNPSSSATPRRDLRSGMSVASVVRSSSEIKSPSPASTALTSFRRLASIAPNSATKSSTSSDRSGPPSRLGGSMASSSSCVRMRSISACSVRTANSRRRSFTTLSLSRIVFARRTRLSESLPWPNTLSRRAEASRSARSRSCVSTASFNTRAWRFSANDVGSGKPSSAGLGAKLAPAPPFKRLHTPRVYSAALAAALSGFSRNRLTPVDNRPRADFALEPTRSTVATTGRTTRAPALDASSPRNRASADCASFTATRAESASAYRSPASFDKTSTRLRQDFVRRSSLSLNSRTFSRKDASAWAAPAPSPTAPAPNAASTPAALVAEKSFSKRRSRRLICASASAASSRTDSHASMASSSRWAACAAASDSGSSATADSRRRARDASSGGFSASSFRDSPPSAEEGSPSRVDPASIGAAHVSAASAKAKRRRLFATSALRRARRSAASASAASSRASRETSAASEGDVNARGGRASAGRARLPGPRRGPGPRGGGDAGADEAETTAESPGARDEADARSEDARAEGPEIRARPKGMDGSRAARLGGWGAAAARGVERRAARDRDRGAEEPSRGGASAERAAAPPHAACGVAIPYRFARVPARRE